MIAFLVLSLLNMLNPSPEIVGRLDIPHLELSEEVVATGYSFWVENGIVYGQPLVDDNHVGWQNLTAPLGSVGNTVLNGHSDIHGMVFQNLIQVQVGDEIKLFSSEQEYSYRVAEVVIVDEVGVSLEQRVANARYTLPTEDDRLTLITCVDGNRSRLIVVAFPL